MSIRWQGTVGPAPAVFGEVFSRPQIHSSVNLTGISGDDLTADPSGKTDGQSRFTRGGRPQDHEEVMSFPESAAHFFIRHHGFNPFHSLECVFDWKTGKKMPRRQWRPGHSQFMMFLL